VNHPFWRAFRLVVAGLIAVVLLTGGPLIARVPLVVLAHFGALKPIDHAGSVRIWRGWRFEGVIVVVAALGVAALGMLWGLLFAVVLAVEAGPPGRPPA
jgi:MFS superfamily sulfate permease-like transporter